MNNKKLKFAREQLRSKYPNFPFPKNSYLVLSSARSGSTLLCKHLQQAGLGDPVEAFNPNTNLRKRLQWRIDYKDPAEYLITAIKKQTTNHFMGMKLFIPQFQLFIETASSLLEDFKFRHHEIVETIFPSIKYICIQRKDKVKQAISYSKAKQNGIWSERVGGDTTYRDYIIPAVYDREHIERCFDELLMEDVAWNHYLNSHHLPFLHVWYEDLATNPEEAISRVYDFLNVTGKEIVRAPLRKQSNKKSKDWESRFRQETPWLQDKQIQEDLEKGDLLSLATARNVMITEQRENERYWQMPATKFRWLRKWFIRGKRKLKSIFTKSKQE